MKKNTQTKNKIPKFKNETEEQNFWAKHDSSELIDWNTAETIQLTKLKPTTHAISIRLPVFLIESIKQIAHKRDIPYQSLLKLLLEEAVSKEKKKNW